MTPNRGFLRLLTQKTYKEEPLLRDSALPVKEISEQVGFADQFHFSKRFKQYSGYSPAQFRARFP